MSEEHIIQSFMQHYTGGMIIHLNRRFQVLGLNAMAKSVFEKQAQITFPCMLDQFIKNDSGMPMAAYHSFEAYYQDQLADKVFHFNEFDFMWTYCQFNHSQEYVLMGHELPKHVLGDEEHKLFQKIINNIPQYIFWKDKNSVFLGCNNNFAQLLGLKNPQDIVGKTDYDFPWSIEQTEAYRADDMEIIKTRVPKLYYEEKQTDAHGVERDVLVSKIPLYAHENNNDEVIGLACIYQDITEKKRLEQALIQAKIHAESANRAKSEFIANMSHDIRTPITGMLGLAQFLKDSAKTVEMAEYSQLLIESTEELLKLLNEVIEIIHLESAGSASRVERFNLSDLISHNVTLLAPAAKHKGIALVYRIASDTPEWLSCSRTNLDRILLNVLSNAVKFTNQGQVLLTVSNKPLTQKSVELILRVEDTGIGIPPDRMADIFDRYTRVSPSYDGIYKGSGIGLYVVKKYLDEMGGQISVESEASKGSIFNISIPCELPDQTRSHHATQHGLVSPVVKQAHVLIVEDNALAARMVKQIFEKLNCVCDHADSASKAFAALEQRKYDLVLMDIGLPGESGLELAHKIRHRPSPALLEQQGFLPIIALTGHMLKEQQQACLDVGMQEVLIKPINIEAAQALLTRWVSPDSRLPSGDLLSIDLTEGAELSGGGEAAARELIALLAKSLPILIVNLARFTQEQNWVALADEVHKLYGGLCYVGVPRLRHLVKTLNQRLELDKRDLESLRLVEEVKAEAQNLLRQWSS
jgi:PAS domain S-box-containing protein